MGFAVVGDEVFDGGDLGKRLEKAGSHEDATGAAESRRDSAETPSVTPAATLFTEVALDFDDAKTYLEVVNVEAARAEDLRTAVAEGADTSAITALNNRTDAEVQAAHATEVLAKPVDRPGRHKGAPYAAGDYVVKHPDDGVLHVPAADFSDRFKLKTAPKATTRTVKPPAKQEG